MLWTLKHGCKTIELRQHFPKPYKILKCVICLFTITAYPSFMKINGWGQPYKKYAKKSNNGIKQLIYRTVSDY